MQCRKRKPKPPKSPKQPKTPKQPKAPKQPSNASTTATTVNTSATAPAGEWQKTNITFYGDKPGQSKGADDNGVGLSGINLDAHATVGLTLNGKPVYAGAVHQFDGPKYMYKVLELTGDVNPLYIHVVDICDNKDKVCGQNVKANGNNFLVDIYRTGWAAAGKNDGVLKGQFRVVGDIAYTKIPKKAWNQEYIMPSCTGKCDSKDRKWIKRPN
jgi:hypothetical protein